MKLVELQRSDIYLNQVQLGMHFDDEEKKKIEGQEPGDSRLRTMKNGKKVTVTLDPHLKRWKLQA